MKSLFFIIGLVALGSCKKETVIEKMEGTWELRKSVSGWAGTHNYPPGNGNTIRFNNNTYTTQTKSADSVYTFSGTFDVYTGKACSSSTEQQLIRFNGDSLPSNLILSNNELTIGSTDCIADGGTVTYQKIGN